MMAVARLQIGQPTIGGDVRRFSRPTDAVAAGIGVVHQERNLIPHFSVGENILLDRIARAMLKPVDYEDLHTEPARWLRVLNLSLDTHVRVGTLSVALMQMVEIARAVAPVTRAADG